MEKTKAGAVLLTLGSVVAALVLLAGPAGAQVSGGAFAENGSVASGTADAHQQSTASGDATARNQSTASGCSTAINQSTASGSDCPRPTTTVRPPATTTTTRPGGGTGGGGTGGASTATGTPARLALTGSWSAPMAAMAALAVASGLWLMVAADRRRSHTA